MKYALSVLEEMPEGEIYILPIRLDECNVPFSLRGRQWLDWFSEEAKRRLLEAIGMHKIPSFKDELPLSNQNKGEQPISTLLWDMRREESYRIFKNGGIEALISRLDERNKVLLLYYYKLTVEGWLPTVVSHKILAYTDIIYLKDGIKKTVTINNYAGSDFDEIVFVYALGDPNDEKHMIRLEYFDAITSLTQEQRDSLFDGIIILDESIEYGAVDFF